MRESRNSDLTSFLSRTSITHEMPCGPRGPEFDSRNHVVAQNPDPVWYNRCELSAMLGVRKF